MTVVPLLARAQALLARAAAAVLARPAASWSPSGALPPLAGLRRILVIRLDEIGDVVLSTAFLRELRRAAPQARIALVVQPSVAGLLRGCPDVDELITYDIQCRRWLRPFVLPLRALRFARQRLQPLRPELTILPRWDADQAYATMLARFSAAPVRVGYSHRVREYKARINAGFDGLLTHALDERGVVHEVERSLALLRWLGASPRPAAPQLAWAPEDENVAEALLAEAGASPDERWVALCPSFGHSVLKQWPPERFAELARQLDARGDVRVVVVGSPADRALAAPIVQALDARALDLTGRTTLPQLAALLSRCALFVGADTGVTHIATAVGIPVVAVFGPTNVARFGPRGQGLITLDLPCSPVHRMPEADRCPRCVLGAPRCMLDLPVALVQAVATQRLDEMHRVERRRAEATEARR